MPEITDLDKSSGMASRLKIDLEARRERLLKKCGRSLNANPVVDQILTAEMRGMIKAYSLLIKEFTTGQADYVGPVE